MPINKPELSTEKDVSHANRKGASKQGYRLRKLLSLARRRGYAMLQSLKSRLRRMLPFCRDRAGGSDSGKPEAHGRRPMADELAREILRERLARESDRDLHSDSAELCKVKESILRAIEKSESNRLGDDVLTETQREKSSSKAPSSTKNSTQKQAEVQSHAGDKADESNMELEAASKRSRRRPRRRRRRHHHHTGSESPQAPADKPQAESTPLPPAKIPKPGMHGHTYQSYYQKQQHRPQRQTFVHPAALDLSHIKGKLEDLYSTLSYLESRRLAFDDEDFVDRFLKESEVFRTDVEAVLGMVRRAEQAQWEVLDGPAPSRQRRRIR
jgi:hypothetical protein